MRIAVTEGGVVLLGGAEASLCGEPDEHDAEWLAQIVSSGAYVAEVVTVDQGVHFASPPSIRSSTGPRSARSGSTSTHWTGSRTRFLG